jgi:hypothetical protein
MIKYSRTGEVWVHVQLIKEGAVQSSFSYAATTVFSPPANISIVSNSVAPDDVDDVTMAFSAWSSPSASYETVRSRWSMLIVSCTQASNANNNMPPPPTRVVSPADAATAAPCNVAAPAPPGLAEMAAAAALACGSAHSISTEQKAKLRSYIITNNGKRRVVMDEGDAITESPGAAGDELTVDNSL